MNRIVRPASSALNGAGPGTPTKTTRLRTAATRIAASPPRRPASQAPANAADDQDDETGVAAEDRVETGLQDDRPEADQGTDRDVPCRGRAASGDDGRALLIRREGIPLGAHERATFVAV